MVISFPVEITQLYKLSLLSSVTGIYAGIVPAIHRYSPLKLMYAICLKIFIFPCAFFTMTCFPQEYQATGL